MLRKEPSDKRSTGFRDDHDDWHCLNELSFGFFVNILRMQFQLPLTAMFKKD